MFVAGACSQTHIHKNKTDDFRHPFCIVIERRGRIGYYAPDGRSALRLSLLLAAGALASPLRKSGTPTSFVSTPSSASKLAPKV